MLEKFTRLFRRGDAPAAGRATVPAPAAKPVATAATVDIDQRLAEVARLDEPAALREIALHDRIARVRLAAAQRIVDAAELETLRRDSNDKAVQRHARETLQARRDQEREAQETRARIAQALAALAQHAGRGWEPLYDAKLDNLAAGWQPLAAAATPAEQEQAAEWLALARDTVQRHHAERNAREQAIAAKQELIAACGELEGVVGRLRREDLSDSLAAVTALRSTQRTRWEEAAALTVVDAPLLARYRAALSLLDRWLAAAAELPRLSLPALPDDDADAETLEAVQEQLDTLLARLDWPEELPPPALLQELAALRRQLQARQRERQADLQQQLAALRRRRHALKRMIDEGQLRVALRTHQWLQRQLEALPPPEAAAERSALAVIEEALDRLRDWYEFASVPKKEELCAEVEALAAQGPGDDIPARATALRALRDRWQTLCAADPDADPQLRERFERAADLAWAPCAAWYAELRRVQDSNLAARTALCTTLAAEITAIDPAHADWKALERRERALRAEWKALEPVRWPEARASQEQFSALVGQLRGMLAAERQRQAARRQALLEAAQALATREPLAAAIEAARRLQQDWQAAGYTDPQADRRLWPAFRQALDAVYARRDAAREADRAAQAAAAAEAARQQAEQQARRQAREQALQQARRAEIDAALAVAALEGEWLAGSTVASGELAATAGSLPKSALREALLARLAAIDADRRPGDAAVAAAAAQLALLTLDLEILLQLPSPPEFSAARMTRQVERLNASLRGSRDGDEQRVLVDRWLATGPVPAPLRQPLQARLATLFNAG